MIMFACSWIWHVTLEQSYCESALSSCIQTIHAGIRQEDLAKLICVAHTGQYCVALCTGIPVLSCHIFRNFVM